MVKPAMVLLVGECQLSTTLRAKMTPENPTAHW
jgi:hypothetical protein